MPPMQQSSEPSRAKAMPSGRPPIWAKTSCLRIVGREEAHDVAGAVADIDVVVLVEDDVLRPVDPVEPDRLDRTQPVVQRIGRVALRGRRRRQFGIGRRHIDLRQELLPVLQPAHVDRHRRQQHQAEQQRAAAAGHAEAHQAVDHDHHDDRADDRLGGRAAAAAEAVAAEHGCGQRRDLEADAGIGAGAAQPRREENAGQRAQACPTRHR